MTRLVCSFIILSFINIHNTCLCNEIHLRSIFNARVIDNLNANIFNIRVSSATECSILCMKHPNCSLVNFQNGDVVNENTNFPRENEPTCELLFGYPQNNASAVSIENNASWMAMCKYK